MILQIGFGHLWQCVESQLKKGSDHHLKAAGGKGLDWALIGNHHWKALCMKHKLEENFVQILHGEYFYLFIFLHTLKRTVWISFPQKQLWAWSIYGSSSEGLRKRCLRFELSESQRLVMNYYKITGDLVIIQQLLEKHWEHQTYSQTERVIEEQMLFKSWDFHTDDSMYSIRILLQTVNLCFDHYFKGTLI